MVRLPRSWRAAYHPQGGGRGGNMLNWRPGLGGTGQQRIRAIPIGQYTGRITGVPLTGGQAQAAVPASGSLTLSVGPQGLGTTWYPASVVISTTTGALDTSTALVYLGAQGVPIALQGTVVGGNGTVALAIPSMTPGQVIIVSWSGAHTGDIAALNVTGTMDALTTG